MLQTIKQLLSSAYQKIDPLDAELLLSFTLGQSREYFIIHSDKKIKPAAAKKFYNLVKQRAKNIPLAYLTGHKEFFGLDFLVNKYTLIPRPDTEIMVEEVIKTINEGLKNKNKLLLIDIGTGAGCIPISILKNIFPIPTIAIDISKKALVIAKKNAKKHRVKIKFLHGSLLAPIQNLKLKAKKCDTVITANLPYLTGAQYKKEKSIQHEPKSALVAKKFGLALYEQLLKQIKLMLANYKLQITCFMEIDPAQTKKISDLINKILPQAEIQIKKDLTGQDRVVIIYCQKTNFC